jgi:hypothetical protein
MDETLTSDQDPDPDPNESAFVCLPGAYPDLDPHCDEKAGSGSQIRIDTNT